MIRSWSAAEVGSWVKSIGLGTLETALIGMVQIDLSGIGQPFTAENDISGDLLVHADHQMLKELGIASVGHRMHLLKAISEKLSTDDGGGADSAFSEKWVDKTGLSALADELEALVKERCLSFDERPLALHNELKDGDDAPVFVLKHIRNPMEY
ncbi:hypothetical protein HK101_002890 [Irineochytrium annulatum]|nr:hypothetical protein HK101_002890 [Irineochytrium annulatum]